MARRGFVVVMGRVEGLPLVMIVAVLRHDGGRYAVDMRPNAKRAKVRRQRRQRRPRGGCVKPTMISAAASRLQNKKSVATVSDVLASVSRNEG